MVGYLGLILGALCVILLSNLWNQLVILIWRPYVLTKMLKKQGVAGPRYKFRSGNLEEIARLKAAARGVELDTQCHDFTPRVLPHVHEWMNKYGGTFLFWAGAEPRLCITDAEQVKQVLNNKFGYFTKGTEGLDFFLALLGKSGLILIDGSQWVRHRRVVSPAFTMDKLKLMTKQMAECTEAMLNNWQSEVIHADGKQKPMEVNRQFEELTADVISHAAFGSSYAEGKEVFLAQKELMMLITLAPLKMPIPGLSNLPTKTDQQKRKLQRKMDVTLSKIIENRLNSKESSGYGKDLLGIMLESMETDQEGARLTTDEIVDECKTFFFAGHETTAQLLTWTMFLLSTNQDWQEKLREEVLKESGMEIPTADTLSKFKLVTMVLWEALRLYGPVNMIYRQASKRTKLGDIEIPEGMGVMIPFMVIHRKRELWGEDADEFNPLRFENGINRAAKHPNALLAFGIGPRACVGQNFAMLEAKMVVAMILQRFSFKLSPDYKHMPASMLTLRPQNGLPIVLTRLAS